MSTGFPSPSLRIGLDLGGTKIEGIALRGTDEQARLRVATPRGDYDATVRAMVDLVHALEARCGTRGSVGIGIPGTVSPATALVKNANSTWLIGRPLQQDLERVMDRPVRIANDANCFAMSEATDGAGAGAMVVFGVIVGTGTGGGLVVRGRLLEGMHGIAGEWGHNPLPWPEAGEWPGPACYCGRTGCIETFLSGPGLVADLIRARQARAAEPLHQELDAVAVVRLATAGDPDAHAAIERYEARMARALASIVNVLDPDVIVLGGGMSNVHRLYENVPRLWARFVFAAGSAEAARTRLVPAVHGDASGVRGAAWLWNDG